VSVVITFPFSFVISTVAPFGSIEIATGVINLSVTHVPPELTDITTGISEVPDEGGEGGSVIVDDVVVGGGGAVVDPVVVAVPVFEPEHVPLMENVPTCVPDLIYPGFAIPSHVYEPTGNS
jgi:hypothetical protein